MTDDEIKILAWTSYRLGLLDAITDKDVVKALDFKGLPLASMEGEKAARVNELEALSPDSND